MVTLSAPSGRTSIPSPTPRAPARPPSARSVRVPSSAVRDLLAVVRSGAVVSLAGGIPDPSLLPTAELQRALTTVAGDPESLQYGPTEGEPALREWVARHELGDADPADVVITHGAQQALSLVVDALVDPDAAVVVERASYLGMLQPLRAAGASIRTIGSDRDGMCTLDLARRLGEGPPPALVYTVPTYHNPTGAVLSQSRRRQLGRLLVDQPTIVVDDDPYRRLGLDAPPPRLRHDVDAERVVTIGSFSKIVAPGLRVGWLHGPPWLVDAVVRLKQSSDLHTTTLGQRALVELLSRDGWLDEHTHGLARVLAHRGEVLVDALHAELGSQVSLDPPRGGMFAWATFAPDLGDTDRLARVALDHGVAFVPGSAFDADGRPSRQARLGFATLDDDSLSEAARRLSAAVAHCRSAGVARSSTTVSG